MTPTNLQPSLQLVDGCVGFPQVCKGSEAHGLRSLRSIRHHQYLDDWLLRPSCSGVGRVIPGFLQPSVSGSQTQQKMEANLRSDSAQFVPQYRHFQMETPETIRLSSKTGEWVTSLDFSDAYFHIPIAPRSRKYLRFFLFHQTFQFTAMPFRLATAPLEFTKVVREVKLMAQARGIKIHRYLDDWLLRAPSPEICLQHARTLLALCQQLRWVVNMTKSGLVPKQVFNFVGYRFDLISGRVLPTQDHWQALRKMLRVIKNHPRCTVRQFMSLIGLLTATEKQVSAGRLHMRPIQWHLKKHGHFPEVLEKVIPLPHSLHPHLDWWLGRTLGGLHCKRRLVSSGKSPSHKFFRNEGSPGFATVRTSLQRSDCSCGDGQYHSGLIHKQARGYEVGLSLCPPLETPVLVPSQGHNTTSQAYPRSLKGNSRQALSAQSSDSDRVVPLPSGVQSVVCQVAPTTSGLVCDQVQSQTAQFGVTSSGSGSLGGGRPELILGTPGRLCFSSSIPAPPNSFEAKGSGLSQDDSDCPRLAKDVLVLGPGGPVGSDTLQPPSGEGSSDSAFQRTSSQEPSESQSSCLAPRSSTIRFL